MGFQIIGGVLKVVCHKCGKQMKLKSWNGYDALYSCDCGYEWKDEGIH